MCLCVCGHVRDRERKRKKQYDRLYNHFNGVKFHFKSYFGFNLNKTLNCIATHLVSHCSLTYPKLTLSLSLAQALRNKRAHTLTLVHTCTHKRALSGCCVSEVLFLYCSHISFWPSSFKLPMGFCMGRGTITFIYEIEGKEREVGDLFVFLFIFFASFLLSLSMLSIVSFPLVSLVVPLFYVSFTHSLSLQGGLIVIAVRTHR